MDHLYFKPAVYHSSSCRSVQQGMEQNAIYKYSQGHIGENVSYLLSDNQVICTHWRSIISATTAHSNINFHPCSRLFPSLFPPILDDLEFSSSQWPPPDPRGGVTVDWFLLIVTLQQKLFMWTFFVCTDWGHEQDEFPLQRELKLCIRCSSPSSASPGW